MFDRYSLVLQGLKDCTTEDHTDYIDILNAMRQLDTVNQILIIKKREREQMTLLLQKLGHILGDLKVSDQIILIMN
jgi:hypothetical protein